MYLFSALHGHGTSCAPARERHADGVQARDELARRAERVERALAHARHDAHAHRHVGGVGQLHADVALVRAERAHREGHHVHRAAAHRAGEQLGQRLAHLRRLAPVVGRARFLLGGRADERAVLHARDVAGIGQRQVGVRALGVGRAARRCPASTSSRHRRSYSSAEPSHQWICVGFGQRGHLLDPRQQALVLGGGGKRSAHCLKRLLDVGCPVARALTRRPLAGCSRHPADSDRPSRAICAKRIASRRRSASQPLAVRRAGAARGRADVGRARPCRGAARHQHEALELGHEHAVLVEHARVHLDGAAVGLGARLPLLEHLGLAEQRVAVEHRRRVLELFGGEVGDRLAADVADGHAERERVDERAHDDVAALLGGARVDVVDVQRVVVHREQAEEVVVGLGHGLGGPVLVDVAHLELLEVASVGVRAARLARGLIGLDAPAAGRRCSGPRARASVLSVCTARVSLMRVNCSAHAADRAPRARRLHRQARRARRAARCRPAGTVGRTALSTSGRRRDARRARARKLDGATPCLKALVNGRPQTAS